MFSKQLASDVVIVFLVQCSQGSVEQTGYHHHQDSYIALLLTGFSLRKPVKTRQVLMFQALFGSLERPRDQLELPRDPRVSFFDPKIVSITFF